MSAGAAQPLPVLTPTRFHDQPCVELSLPQGDRIRVALHGAHVLSWTTADGVERLYLSPRAHVDGHSPIRGGVPICFPQFNQRALGDVALPKHGLARTATWTLMPTEADGPQAQVSFTLQDNAATRALWPAEFNARFSATLAPGRLRLAFDVTNTGDTAWPFALALHTYLKVDDIAGTRLDGLDGLSFWDGVQNLRQPEVRQQQTGALTFASETDRVYEAVQAPLTVSHGGGSVAVTQSDNLTEAVVWNPGATLCAALDDMPDDGYRQMLCVEAARINAPVLLQPGQSWCGWQDLHVVA